MLLTSYSMVMAVLWSSVFIIIISILRKNYHFLDISSVYGMVVLYLFCLARIFIPVEFSWTRIIRIPNIYNKFFRFFTMEVFHIRTYHICVHHIIYTIWITGAILMFIILFYQYYKNSSEIKNLPLNTESFVRDTAMKIVKEKYNKNVEIVVSPEINEPVSIGVMHRKILIPDYEYSEKELYYILAHEFAHLKNHDLVVQLLVNILCSVYWWNPLVYLLRKGLEKSFELRCDHMVIQSLDQKGTADYLETILRVFRDRDNPKHGIHNKASLLGMADDNIHELKERFKLVSRVHKSKTKPYGKWAVTGIMMCLIVLSYSFVLQTYFQTTEDQIETKAAIYELTALNGYIVKYADGTYILITDEGYECIIDKETADKLIYESGLKIIEEESNYEEN